jgi:hypothetical protein
MAAQPRPLAADIIILGAFDTSIIGSCLVSHRSSQMLFLQGVKMHDFGICDPCKLGKPLLLKGECRPGLKRANGQCECGRRAHVRGKICQKGSGA